MNARKSDSLRAQEVLETIGETFERLRAFGISEERFLSDDDLETRVLVDALLMCVLRATEEAGKLSDDSKFRHPEIDWRGVSGMRNYLVHDYGNVDRRIVWDAVNEEFGPWRRHVGRLSKKLGDKERHFRLSSVRKSYESRLRTESFSTQTAFVPDDSVRNAHCLSIRLNRRS